MAFYPAARLIDLYDGCLCPFRAAGYSLLLLQADGAHYIVENRCPHMDAPLHTGQMRNGAITCRAHGIAFDLASGRARGPLSDTLDCLRKFPVAYEGNQVGVEL